MKVTLNGRPESEWFDARPRRCLICKQPRVLTDALADSIAHAPCDQQLARELAVLEPDDTPAPGFWDSAGKASYDA